MENINETGAEKFAPVFNLRKLKATDVFQMVRILSKIGLKDASKAIDKDTMKALKFKAPTMMEDDKEVPLPREKWTEAQEMAESDAEAASDQVLLQAIGLVVDHIGNCENEIFKILADGLEKTTDEVKNMEAAEFMQLIYCYIGRESFKDFFMQAWKLLDSINIRNS